MRLDEDAIQVGDRVLCEDVKYSKQLATVKYIGNIIGKYGVWVGLELDEPIEE